MGFKDQNGCSLINDEQKIRIPLSTKAQIIINEDMHIFGLTKTATFINLIFDNYKEDAKSSISSYLQHKRSELEFLLNNERMNESDKNNAINIILDSEKSKLKDELKNLIPSASENKLYHINKKNVEYLTEDCTENEFYDRPGLYIRSVIEEYCSLPFIKRERIFKRDIYEIVEQACHEKNILKIKADYYGKKQIFYVYPYRIVNDSFDTQSYLVCYSRKAEEPETNKIIASFSMARISAPTKLRRNFHLNKSEILKIESQITHFSPAYLIGKNELIYVRLTKKGKKSYQTRLYSRPEKIESLSNNNTYVFDCTQQQIFDYFFPFGSDAEIMSPECLRNRFIKSHKTALDLYNVSDNMKKTGSV